MDLPFSPFCLLSPFTLDLLEEIMSLSFKASISYLLSHQPNNMLMDSLVDFINDLTAILWKSLIG